MQFFFIEQKIAPNFLFNKKLSRQDAPSREGKISACGRTRSV
jgi:hypothetical protein